MLQTQPRESARTELAVVRHGQTEFNRRGLYQGHADSALTDAGMAQARLLAPRLRSLGSSPTIYCSDLGRARHTAELLATPGFHHIREDEGLRERCWGVFEGLSRAEITERYPDARTSGAPNPDYTPHGGETLGELNERIVGTLNRIAHSHAGERVIVVTHGGVVMAFARYVLGVPQDAPRRFDIGNTSLSLFYCYGDRGWKARFLGDVSHLEQRGHDAVAHR
ncbi:MAG: histidine phosphatase family protein [Gammaproteobacteria bacterium]|nr:histidine phosphatase family protein [Gammaproteobacteria bacterium]